MEDCIFCKIIAGEIPSTAVYEDEDFKAILDVGPAARGHVIIIPKKHAANIYELEDEDAAKVFPIAKKIATALKKTYDCDGVNVLQNNGKAAGQTVFHFHMHLIPRYENDGNQDRLCWNHQEVSPEEMEEICRKLQQPAE